MKRTFHVEFVVYGSVYYTCTYMQNLHVYCTTIACFSKTPQHLHRSLSNICYTIIIDLKHMVTRKKKKNINLSISYNQCTQWNLMWVQTGVISGTFSVQYVLLFCMCTELYCTLVWDRCLLNRIKDSTHTSDSAVHFSLTVWQNEPIIFNLMVCVVLHTTERY